MFLNTYRSQSTNIKASIFGVTDGTEGASSMTLHTAQYIKYMSRSQN